MLGVFAEFETNLRRERHPEGIAKAKAAGVYKGRRSVTGARTKGSRHATRHRQGAQDRAGVVYKVLWQDRVESAVADGRK
jgi:DNA invertase Pin-like site-specific DNA recombinase